MNKSLTRTISLLLFITLIGSSCCSYAVYKGSHKNVALRKATLANNEPAIRAVTMGGDGLGLGIDVSNIETLTERPWVQVVAAIIDLALMYGTYEGVKAVDPANDNRGDINVYVMGSNCTINVTN